MNILDEDIGLSQRHRLIDWKIRFRQIGVEIGRSGMKDRTDIIPLLHRLRRPTFFTLDHGFYHPTLRHQGYCLVFLDVWEDEAAEYIRRFLRHTAAHSAASWISLHSIQAITIANMQSNAVSNRSRSTTRGSGPRPARGESSQAPSLDLARAFLDVLSPTA